MDEEKVVENITAEEIDELYKDEQPEAQDEGENLINIEEEA